MAQRTGQVGCPDCGFDLRDKVVSIESMDTELWELSGIYCPRCFTNAILEHAGEFEQLETEYLGFKREMRRAEVLPASA